MIRLASGIDYVDLNFLGFPNIIATAVLHGPGRRRADRSRAVDEPAELRAALERKRHRGCATSRQILLTHIHLDHAGVTGTLVKENPAIEVFVHERGAPHLVDPSKLLASATRLYGQDMERLWGEFLPVPARAAARAEGRRDDRGRRARRSTSPTRPATPRITSATSTRRARIAFVGDTAGIRRGSGRT